MSELSKKVKFGIELIRNAAKMAEEHGSQLEIAYSGGKDSDCILRLAQLAGVKFDAIYKNTTIDVPGTISHVRENGVRIVMPKHTFAELIEQNSLPSLRNRHCCKYLKEYKIHDYAIIGIRKEESIKRKKRYIEPETCRVFSRNEKVRQYFPLLNWTLDDVKEFVESEKIRLANCYYREDGTIDFERRLGCIGCPMASKKKRLNQLCRYPKFVLFLLQHVNNYLQTHTHTRSYVVFDCNPYNILYKNLFCQTILEYRNNINTLFGKTNTRELLEDYFKIDLTIK